MRTPLLTGGIPVCTSSKKECRSPAKALRKFLTASPVHDVCSTIWSLKRLCCGRWVTPGASAVFEVTGMESTSAICQVSRRLPQPASIRNIAGSRDSSTSLRRIIHMCSCFNGESTVLFLNTLMEPGAQPSCEYSGLQLYQADF